MGFKGVYKKFNGCLKKVSKVFQGCFEKVSRAIQGILKGVSMEFKWDSKVFTRSSMDV